jgi:hypothetical protein
MKFETTALAAGPIGAMTLVETPRGYLLRRDGVDVAILDVDASNEVERAIARGFVVEVDIALIDGDRAFGTVEVRRRRLFEGAAADLARTPLWAWTALGLSALIVAVAVAGFVVAS